MIPVDQNALGHAAQVGAGLFDDGDLGGEDTGEGVLREIRRIHGVTQFFSQRRVQPAVMAAVQGFDCAQVMVVIRGKGFAHGCSFMQLRSIPNSSLQPGCDASADWYPRQAPGRQLSAAIIVSISASVL